MVTDIEWSKTVEELEKQGIKFQSYWTLGRYDAIHVIEAPSEKDAMKILLRFQEMGFIF